MRLAAMVDLVLKQMHQQPVAAFALHPRVAVDPYDIVEPVRRQRIAEPDQALVHRGLRAAEIGEQWKRHLILPGLWPEPAALDRIHIEQVDDVDVVQGPLQAGKEAAPFGYEI